MDCLLKGCQCFFITFGLQVSITLLQPLLFGFLHCRKTDLPDLHGFILSSRSNTLSFRCPGDSTYRTSVTIVRQHGFPRVHVPHLHCLAFSCRSNILPIGGPGDGKHGTSMPTIAVHNTLNRAIPDVDDTIIPTRDNVVSIW